MSEALKVWGRADSSNVQAVMWCIAELGLSADRVDVGHRFGGTDTPEFIAMNPNRTVPVLQDGDGPFLWESGAILRYLANRYAPEPFWPRDAHTRAHVDRWAEWSKINVAMAFTQPVFWAVVRTAPADQDPKAIAQAIDRLEINLAIADRQLADTAYLAGDTLTLADIQFSHQLFRYFDIDIPRAPLPALASYYARLTERAAFRDHVMLSYEALRVT